MTATSYAGAFLTCGDKVLLLRRGMHKARGPGMWAGVGGHVEPCEWDDPEAACYREIQEEAGIPRQDIRGLRYIITGREEDGGLYIVYYYLGSLERECLLPDCDEGTLGWVPVAELPLQPMWFPLEQAMRHWLAHPQGEGVFHCAVNRWQTQATWAEV